MSFNTSNVNGYRSPGLHIDPKFTSRPGQSTSYLAGGKGDVYTGPSAEAEPKSEGSGFWGKAAAAAAVAIGICAAVGTKGKIKPGEGFWNGVKTFFSPSTVKEGATTIYNAARGQISKLVKSGAGQSNVVLEETAKKASPGLADVGLDPLKSYKPTARAAKRAVKQAAKNGGAEAAERVARQIAQEQAEKTAESGIKLIDRRASAS